jgi:hypothetical protein
VLETEKDAGALSRRPELHTGHREFPLPVQPELPRESAPEMVLLLTVPVSVSVLATGYPYMTLIPV